MLGKKKQQPAEAPQLSMGQRFILWAFKWGFILTLVVVLGGLALMFIGPAVVVAVLHPAGWLTAVLVVPWWIGRRRGNQASLIRHIRGVYTEAHDGGRTTLIALAVGLIPGVGIALEQGLSLWSLLTVASTAAFTVVAALMLSRLARTAQAARAQSPQPQHTQVGQGDPAPRPTVAGAARTQIGGRHG